MLAGGFANFSKTYAHVLQVIPAGKGQKTSKYIGKNNISSDSGIGIKLKNFAAYFHEEKTKYFQLKLLSITYFKVRFVVYQHLLYGYVFTWFLQSCFNVFNIAYMPSRFDQCERYINQDFLFLH